MKFNFADYLLHVSSLEGPSSGGQL